jgi:hypothetical protein
MAVLSEMAPNKKRLISKLVLRALLAGSISCFMSAAIAGKSGNKSNKYFFKLYLKLAFSWM